MQGRRAEAAVDRAADGEVRREVVAAGDLAGHGVTEVRIVLVTQGGVIAELVGEVAADVGIDADIVAALVDGVVRTEAAEALGARRNGAGGQRARAVGLQFAGFDLVGLMPRFQAKRQGQRRRQADIERAADIGVEHRLVVLHFAVVERGLRRRAIGRVDAVQRVVLQFVAAIGQAVVLGPLAGGAADAEGRRIVLGLGVDDRQEAVGIDRGDVAGVVGVAEEGRRLGIIVGVAGVAVQLPLVVDGLAGIDENRDDALFRVAVAAGDGGRRDVLVDVGAVGGVALLGVDGDRQEAVRAQLEAGPAVDVGGGAIVDVARRPGALEIGVVLAVRGFDAATVVGFAQVQVQHAGDGVGTVLRRGAVTQHFDAVERGFGNGVQVDGGRTAAGRAVDVDQGRAVLALSVDQDEGLVRRQAAQAGRADIVGAVDGGRTREVQRRGDARQGLAQFAVALGLQGIGGDDVDGRQGVEARAAGGALAGHHDFGGVGSGRCGRSRGRCRLGEDGRSCRKRDRQRQRKRGRAVQAGSGHGMLLFMKPEPSRCEALRLVVLCAYFLIYRCACYLG